MSESEVFNAALKVSPAQRGVYLDRACGNDANLRREVDSLLAAHDPQGEFLEHPALDPRAACVTEAYQSLLEGPGAIIGPYKLLQKIGEGGFGVVYMAEQEQPVRRKVALKIIKPGMDTAQVVARFESERQALAMMDHPNIARVLDAGTVGDSEPRASASGLTGPFPYGHGSARPYFVMELVKGVPITEFCDRIHMPAEQRLELFMSVCHAVQHAHHKGIIHRDIKPSNVMVTLHDGVPVVKVIDFGVAKAISQKLTERTLFTAYGQMIGTPAYMSPEQAEMSGLDIDTRSDIYSLGVLLYELLTGTTPLDLQRLREAGYAEMQRLIREEQAPRPSTRLSSLGDSATVLAGNRGTDPKQLARLLAGDLDWIVMKAVDKDRNRRYETPGNFAADIGRYLRRDAIDARPPSTAYKLKKFVQRNRTAVLTAAAVAAALVAGAGIATWQAVRATAAERQARENALQARHEASVAKEVSGFWRSLLSQADPFTQGDPNLRVRSLLDMASQDVADKFQSQPLLEAALRETLGDAYCGLTLHEAAAEHYRRAWEIRRREQGPQEPETILAQSGLGYALARTDRFDAAEPILLRSLEESRRAFGERDGRTLAVTANLAELFRFQGEFAKAEPLLIQALDAIAASPDMNDADRAYIVGVACYFYLDLGRQPEAERLMERQLATSRKLHGEQHPITLGGRAELLLIRMRSGNSAALEAEALDLLAAHRRFYGHDHHCSLVVALNLSEIYTQRGNFPAAEALAQETLQVCQQVLGDSNAITLLVRVQLATVYDHQGRFSEAEPLLNEALAGWTRIHGPDHPKTLQAKNALGANLLRQGKFAEAEAYFADLEAACRRTFHDAHPLTLFALQNLGTALDGQEKFQDAETRWLELLERCRRLENRGESIYDGALSSLGRNRLHQAKFQDAEAPLRECLAIRLERGPDEWRRFNAESLLGGSLLGQKRYDEAQLLLLSGYEGMKAREQTIDSLWRHLLHDALERLVQLYDLWGKPADAEKWRKELEERNGKDSG